MFSASGLAARISLFVDRRSGCLPPIAKAILPTSIKQSVATAVKNLEMQRLKSCWKKFIIIDSFCGLRGSLRPNHLPWGPAVFEGIRRDIVPGVLILAV